MNLSSAVKNYAKKFLTESPTQTIYVIVHNDMLEKPRSEEGQRVYAEIQKIKDAENHLILTKDMPARNLHPDMPSPSQDLAVLVLGGYKKICVDLQLRTLTDHGYAAKLHHEGCFNTIL